MSATKILWGQITLVFAIVLVTLWGATQWTAWRLGYQLQLGPPWFEFAGIPVYLPPTFFWWWYAYDAYAPSIFVEGALIAASGGVISSAVAIGMSVWRAREAKNVATYGSARWATVREARNAAIYLRTLPTIQPDHIGIIGFSHGGTTALYTALASGAPTDRGGRPFQAVVAYYPGCLLKVRGEPETILGEPASDVLILIGENDDWTPAPDCLKYVELQSGFPHAPTIKVYPGAVHIFDAAFRVYLDQEGHMQGAHPEARADSYVMTKDFFDARLKSK